MPRPPRYGLGPAGRVVRLLAYLSDHGGSADSVDIRRGIPSYQGSTGHRMWRRDLRELRSRGLICPHDPADPQGTAVVLAPLTKPKDLFLTRAEHEALQRARRLLGRTASSAAPLPADAPDDLRALYRVVRYVEERGHRPIPFAEATKDLGVTEVELTALLRQVVEFDAEVEEDPAHHRALDWIDYLPPDADDPVGFLRMVDPAEAAGDAANTIWGHDRGTGQLGHFAYSYEETAERLALIADAETSGLKEADLVRLRSARLKLELWLEHLRRF